MRILILASFLVLATGAASMADTVAFLGPAGWSHNPPAATDPNRVVDQWHISGDISSVTFIKDSTATYDGAMGLIRTNFSTNKIKPSIDRDMACRGTTGHMVEFTFGPDSSRLVVNRLLVPDGTGVDTITYTRSDGAKFDSDVQAAEKAYCTPA